MLLALLCTCLLFLYLIVRFMVNCFFFQAEDGIRDIGVTGVQTCALPIFTLPDASTAIASIGVGASGAGVKSGVGKIGRASCRERVGSCGGAVSLKIT